MAGDTARGVRIPRQARKSAVDNTPIREIKSVVVLAQFFILGPFYALAISLAMFSVVILAAAQSLTLRRDLEQDPFAFFIVPGVLALGILIVCMVWSGLKAFGRRTYTIYPDHIEYHEGFWTRQWHSV